MLNKISFPLNYTSNTNTPTYHCDSTTITNSGGSNTLYHTWSQINTNTLTYRRNSTTHITTVASNSLHHTNQINTKTITIPGTDISVNDDWQNNICIWYIKKYGVEVMLEFIEDNPIYLEFLDRDFSDYLKDMKKIADRNKKIERIIG